MEANGDIRRYHRQIQLKEIGPAGQERLARARVLVVGAGGLGCPALQYLAAAGVGCIGVADFDAVDISNLQRQILYQASDVGTPKVEAAIRRLTAQNPEVRLECFSEKISTENALDIIAGFDLVVDGSDNFPTRYLVNDACVLLDKPLVYGSVFRFEGQVGVFNVLHDGIKTNYRDLFPNPPDSSEVADCNEAGVIGVVPGIIGTMQAGEAIKIITAAGQPLYNRLLTYNVLNNRMYELEIFPNTDALARIPKTREAFLEMDYDWFCHIAPPTYTDLSGPAFDRFREAEAPLIIDVRQAGELPRITEFECLCIPLPELEQNLHRIVPDRPVVVLCQSGVRSVTAATLIAGRLGHPRVYHLKGGIVPWKTNR